MNLLHMLCLSGIVGLVAAKRPGYECRPDRHCNGYHVASENTCFCRQFCEIPLEFENCKGTEIMSLSLGLIRHISPGNIAPVKDFFGYNTQMRKLYFSNNEILRIDPETFVGFPRSLTFLSLLKNNLTRLVTDQFQGLGNLNELIIRQNKITAIEDGAFMSLVNLEILNIAKNRLTSLTGGMFLGLSNMKKLSVYENPIDVIDGETFAQMPYLTYLDIEDLEEVEMPSRALGHLRAVEPVQILAENTMVCGECGKVWPRDFNLKPNVWFKRVVRYRCPRRLCIKA